MRFPKAVVPQWLSSPIVSLCATALLTGLTFGGTTRLFPNLVQRYYTDDPNARNPIGFTEGPKNLAAGDLNGDGLADIVTANLDGSLSVLLARPGGSFSEQLLTPARGLLEKGSLREVELADFNGDGLLDAAAADIARKAVVILNGAGDGRFEPSQLLALGAPARGLAVGDIDKDGFFDLVVIASRPDCEQTRGDHDNACRQGNVPLQWAASVWILRGRGDGTLNPPQLLCPPFCGCLYDVEITDLEGDGFPDILVLDLLSSQLRIFKGVGAGAFSVASPLHIPPGGSRAFAVGYVDEQWLEGSPPEGATFDLVVADRDRGVLYVFLGEGNGSFGKPITISAGEAPRDIAPADLDGDGYLDLVLTNRNRNTISVLAGLGDGSFRPVGYWRTGTSPRHVVLADFNGDGAVDAAVNNRISSDVSIFFGSKGVIGFLRPSHEYDTGVTPIALACADFNGDRYPDVVTANLRSADLRVRFNLGDGRFGPETCIPLPVQAGSWILLAVEAVDLNSDGNQDLVVGGAVLSGGAPGVLISLLGLGNGSFAAPAVTRTGLENSRPLWIRPGDMDADGKPDVVMGTTRGQIVLARGNGDGTFAKIVTLPGEPGGRPVCIALADFTGDGLLDIAASNLKLYTNDGSFFGNTYTGGIRSITASGRFVPWYLDCADLDGDGNADIMLALSFDRPDPLGLFFGNGDGTFSKPVIYGAPDRGVVSLDAADLDEDGITDIVVGDRCGASIIVFKGLGNREFVKLPPSQVYSLTAVRVADLNLDGRPDILGVGSDSLWALINGAEEELVVPIDDSAPLPRREGVISINEVLPGNRTVDRLGPNEVTPDWVELFNGGKTAEDLTGWRLICEWEKEEIFPFPEGIVVPPNGYLVLFFGDQPDADTGVPSLYFSSRGLPRSGAKLELVDAEARIVDVVQYSNVPADVSVARVSDGALSFVLNPVPTMGRANSMPENIKPLLSPENVVLSPGGELFAIATLSDDIAIAFASVVYRVEGQARFVQEVMSDDGMHGDRRPDDGIYGARIQAAPGSTIEYYFRAVDIEGNVRTKPGDIGNHHDLYHVRVPDPTEGLPTVRISEVVASNQTSLETSDGRSPDWIELVNCGNERVCLENVVLTDEIFDKKTWLDLSRVCLAPGERIVILCGGEEGDGLLHAPFHLSASGGEVILLRNGPVPTLLDCLPYPPLAPDAAYGRLECGAKSRLLPGPTPGFPNNEYHARFRRGDFNANGRPEIGDAIAILQYLFSSSPKTADCLKAGDANDSGDLDIADVIYILGYLFSGGPAMPDPFPQCGYDLTKDSLTCGTYSPCSLRQ